MFSRPVIVQSILGQLLVASLFALAAVTTHAQVDRATVNGIVKDANGAIVSGAKVTLTSTNIGLTRETTTNADGFFTLIYVPVGPYKLTVVQQGFATARIDTITLGPGDTRTVEIALKVGAVDSVIDVLVSWTPNRPRLTALRPRSAR